MCCCYCFFLFVGVVDVVVDVGDVCVDDVVCGVGGVVCVVDGVAEALKVTALELPTDRYGTSSWAVDRNVALPPVRTALLLIVKPTSVSNTAVPLRLRLDNVADPSWPNCIRPVDTMAISSALRVVARGNKTAPLQMMPCSTVTLAALMRFNDVSETTVAFATITAVAWMSTAPPDASRSCKLLTSMAAPSTLGHAEVTLP